jgi:nucleotide-binding universal stress UspA family protein
MSEELKPVAEILVPMDFSECSICALEFAKRIAASSNARLHLLYVDDDPILMQPTTDQAFRDQHQDQMATKFIDLLPPDQRKRFRAVMAVRMGTAYHEIEGYAEQMGIELVVMGNIGRSAIADVLVGSVTAHVLRHAHCPVLSVKNLSSGSG